MCGIAGLLFFDGRPVSREVVERMTLAQAHRGPDGQDVGVWGPVGLGHRRLAIIDLEGGRQPMSNEDKTVWITYNGELYNFKELHSTLASAGHVFKTRSDTEVIVHAYEQWGASCVERFRGMFAFCVADLRKRRLFLARDHLGIKPLCYVRTAAGFAFASELAALHGVLCDRFTLNLEAIDRYLWLNYIPAPETAFAEVRKMPPAHRLTVGFDGRTSGPEEYWRLEYRPDATRGEADWVEAADEVIRQSVTAHLVSDVPFGAFLSGGIDSSLVLAHMTRALSNPVRAFTIGFDEADFSEVDYAREVATRCGAEHHVEKVRPDALAILPDLVRHYGEPFGDSSAIPTYYVCRMGRAAVPMILSGDGGDELFAGYETYRRWLAQVYREDLAGWRRMLWRAAAGLFPGVVDAGVTLEKRMATSQYLPRAARRMLWRPEFRGAMDGGQKWLEDEFSRTKGWPALSVTQYMDEKTYLPFDILTKVDVASMMHGLEVRTPITDVRVAEFAATIPWGMHARRGPDGGWELKRVLKAVAARHFEPGQFDRPKMGFAVPLRKWFGPGGASRVMLEERLIGKDSQLGRYFSADYIRVLLQRDNSGAQWLLLFLDEWLRQNKARLE